MPLAVVAAVGFFVLTGLAWLCSENRRAISWRTVAWGLGLQLLIGLLVFRLPGSRRLFVGLNEAVLAFVLARNGFIEETVCLGASSAEGMSLKR